MINLRDTIKDAFREVFDETQAQGAYAQKVVNDQVNQLRNRPNWKNIQPHFDKALNDHPKIQKAIASGRMSLLDLYDRLNDRYLMSGIQDAKGAPSVERKAPAVAQAPQRQPEARGTPEEVLKRLLPDTDPLLRY